MLPHAMSSLASLNEGIMEEKKDIPTQQQKADVKVEDATTRLSSDELSKIAGGVLRRGGDDDLDDLEVER
jgi:hypothetical protein